MKKILITIAAVATATSLTYAQGTVNFITSSLGASAKVTEAAGFGGAGQAVGNTAVGAEAGSHFLAQLFRGNGVVGSSGSLVAVGSPVNIRAGTGNSGYVQETGTSSLGLTVDPALSLPTSQAGGAVTVQLRVWWAGATGNTFQTWDAAVAAAANPNMRLGGSPLLNLASTGNPGSIPPGTPAALTGLSGFQLTAVPEPSTFVLAGLAAAGLLIFRRRK